MVQRKGPDIGVGKFPPTKGQANREKPPPPAPGSQDEKKKGKEAAGGMSQLKRKLKKARSIKRVVELGELDVHLGHAQEENLTGKPPPETPEHSMTPAAAAKSHKPGTPPAKNSCKLQQPLPKASPSKGSDHTSAAAAPNYMKATNSSDARKEQQLQVRFRPVTPPTTPAAAEKNKTPKKSNPFSKPPKAPSTPAPAPTPPPRSIKRSGSIKKLTRKLSLKPIRSLMRKCSDAMFHNGGSASANKPTPCSSSDAPPPMFPNVAASKPTCSSTLKDSKFPRELELDPGGTEAQGTSALKVCPFNYCSLNGHHHHSGEPAQPLKRFLSMRRRSIKKQKSVKLRQLSVKRRGPSVTMKGLKRAKSRKGGCSVDVSPAMEMADDNGDDFFLEIYDDPRGGNVDPNLYDDGGADDDARAKIHSTKRAEEPSDCQGFAVVNNHQSEDSNTNGEAGFQSTTGTEVTRPELQKRLSMKLRQLSVRRRSQHKSLKRAKSRRRASTEVFHEVDFALPDNHGDDFFAETYDVPRGGIVDPHHLYDSSTKYEGSGDNGEAIKLHRKGGAIKDHKLFIHGNTYRGNEDDDKGEADSRRGTEGAQVPGELQKGVVEQRLTTRPTADSYTELSFDDNFDMVSEASFSETEVIEQFLEKFLTQEEDPPAEETFLPSAHKDRKRWGSGWDPDRNMVFAAGSFQDERESKLVPDSFFAAELEEAMSEYAASGTLLDELNGSKCEHLSDGSSTAALIRDPSCEIDMGGETLLLERRNGDSFTMDEIYCRFNISNSEINITRETKDTDEQKPEPFQQGGAEGEHSQEGEEGQYQLVHQEFDESTKAEVIPAATEGGDERGLPETGNSERSSDISDGMQAAEDITGTGNGSHDMTDVSKEDGIGASCAEINIKDMSKDVETGASCADISTSEEATEDSCSLLNSSSIEQSSQSSLEGEKDDKDTENSEESITPTTTKQRKPTAEDSYDKLARKAIEDSVEEVYIYSILKGSEGPEIIKAITDAMTDPDQGVQQGPQIKPKSRFNMTRSKAVRYLDKIRSFNPRPPNFLPVEPDPDAERVDLRHQEMNGKKDAEEWMIDHALQKLLNRMAPAQKKVTLIIKAYEAVTLPVPTPDRSLQHEDVGFGRTRPAVQACS